MMVDLISVPALRQMWLQLHYDLCVEQWAGLLARHPNLTLLHVQL